MTGGAHECPLIPMNSPRATLNIIVGGHGTTRESIKTLKTPIILVKEYMCEGSFLTYGLRPRQLMATNVKLVYAYYSMTNRACA